MSYALVLVDDFSDAFARLQPAVQEVILDDLEVIADRAAEASASSPRLPEPSLQVHRHEGFIEGEAFRSILGCSSITRGNNS